jgi:hypothetical protein
MNPVEDALERFRSITETLPFVASVHNLYGGFRERRERSYGVERKSIRVDWKDK